jgi:hypothetical protein
MNTLRIEVEKDGIVVDSKQDQYKDEKDFFRALVSICDDLNLEVPIWTCFEDRSIAKKGFAKIGLDGSSNIRITILP